MTSASAIRRLSDFPTPSETIITPEIFASHLCADLRLPVATFYKEIVSQIRRHIEEAQLTENYTNHLGDDLAAVREENRSWFEGKASKRRRTINEEGDVEMGQSGTEEEPRTLRDFPRQEGVNDELRVVIKVSRQPSLYVIIVHAYTTRAHMQLDITLDSLQLVDKFEWDLSDARNSPEAFAETFTAELGLAGEFR